MHGQAEPAERGREGAGVLRTRIELGGAPPDFPRGAAGPESGRQRPKGVVGERRGGRSRVRTEAGAFEEGAHAVAGGAPLGATVRAAAWPATAGRLARHCMVSVFEPQTERSIIPGTCGKRLGVPDPTLRGVVDP